MDVELLKQLIPFGIAGGVSAPTVFAINQAVQGPEALPWSICAVTVIMLLTGGLITLPQHKRELKQVTDINDRMFDQVEQLIENDTVIIKALEDIKAGTLAYSRAASRRPGDRR